MIGNSMSFDSIAAVTIIVVCSFTGVVLSCQVALQRGPFVVIMNAGSIVTSPSVPSNLTTRPASSCCLIH